jgi:hypothetical protein
VEFRTAVVCSKCKQRICLGRRLRFRLLQDSRQRKLSILPQPLSLRRLLGSVLERTESEADMRRTAPAAAKHELTEPEAIRRAQDGDATAFEYLYNSHSRRVYSLCLRMIRNRAEAEDLTQQAFLQVFRKIGTFRADSVFSTWLHRLTVNIVLMHLRGKSPKEVLFAGSDLSRARRQDRQKYPQAMSVLSLARQHS